MVSWRGAGRRVRGAEVWAAAKEGYLAGHSALEVCELFGLGLSALRARARREGWRRVDQAEDQPDPELAEDLDEELEADGPADFVAMSDRTARLAARALAEGDLRGAEGWMRLHQRLEPLAYEARRRADAEARALQNRPSPEAETAPPPADVHSVHSVHAVHAPDGEPDTGDGAEPPPEEAASLFPKAHVRAERARLARLRALDAAQRAILGHADTS